MLLELIFHPFFRIVRYLMKNIILVTRRSLSNSKARVNVPLLLIHRSHEVVNHDDWTSLLSTRVIRSNMILLLSQRPFLVYDRELSHRCRPTLWCWPSVASEPILTVVCEVCHFLPAHRMWVVWFWPDPKLCFAHIDGDARVHFELPLESSVHASTISGFVLTYTSSRYVNKRSYLRSSLCTVWCAWRCVK